MWKAPIGFAVYPRWRGEHITATSTILTELGLSPLARGTHCAACCQLLIRRFIPAGAGNTGKKSLISPVCPVYPRWRGEHEVAIRVDHLVVGLSPLARGTRVCERRQAHDRRFIPAGAGNTMHAKALVIWKTVYPRWRGEHTHSVYFLWYSIGLSPLARGTPVV